MSDFTLGCPQASSTTPLAGPIAILVVIAGGGAYVLQGAALGAGIAAKKVQQRFRKRREGRRAQCTDAKAAALIKM